MSRIYVASSWRNHGQPAVVAALRAIGHEVYDFRHPAPGNDGFAWRALDPNWERWTPEQFRTALDGTIARDGFKLDMDALKACDVCLLVLPCGRSAHLELGYAVGAGKRTVVLMDEQNEPELMYRMVDALCVDLPEALIAAGHVSPECLVHGCSCGLKNWSTLATAVRSTRPSGGRSR